MSFYDIFGYIYFTLLASCVIAGLGFWKKLKPGFRLLSVLILGTLIVEIVARWMVKVYNQNNAAYIAYDIINIVLTPAIFNCFMASKINKNLIFFTDAIIIIFYVIDVLALKRYIVDYSLINCTIGVYFCFLSCMYLLDKMQKPLEKTLFKVPEFLFSIFVLFFYSISVLYWIIFLKLKAQEAREISALLFKLFLVSNLIFYSGILFTFTLSFKTKRANNERKHL